MKNDLVEFGGIMATLIVIVIGAMALVNANHHYKQDLKLDSIQITLSQQNDSAWVERSAYELLMIASELDCQHLGGVKSTSDEYTWECNLSE